ncbi:MAG: hypothetical protein GXO39_05000 [Thermotogae bacterium]|nr:hypothetical protein [Thermotogota bacterium]
MLLYLLPFFLRLLNGLRRGLALKIPLDNPIELLTTPFVGRSSDTFLYYLPPAYGILKYGDPILILGGKVVRMCYRVVQSWILLPFMASFDGYFSLAYLIFFSLLYSIGVGLLLWHLNPRRTTLNLLLALLLLPVVGYYLPFVMLEAPASSFLILYLFFLLLYVEGGNILSIILGVLFLSLAILLRPETIVAIFPLVVSLRRFSHAFTLLPVVIPLSLNVSQTLSCGDQSNFFMWNYAFHLERTHGVKLKEVGDLINVAGNRIMECVGESPDVIRSGDKKLDLYLHMFQVKGDRYSRCFRKLFLSEANAKEISFAFKQVSLNFLSVLFPSISPELRAMFNLNLPLAKFLLRLYLGLYGLITVVSLGCAFICGDRTLRFTVLSYLFLSLLYAFYNPLGHFDTLRFKTYLSGFELLFIAYGLKKVSAKSRLQAWQRLYHSPESE